MIATKALRQAAAATHAERKPMIQFIGKRSIPANIDHAPQAHPASPTHSLPNGFAAAHAESSSTSFSSYRQTAQQHGPLGHSALTKAVGARSGQSLGSVQPKKGEAFDRNELPERFRRRAIELLEINAIETGGATLVS